jgi:alkylated DNA repair dioxygenase AlkB
MSAHADAMTKQPAHPEDGLPRYFDSGVFEPAKRACSGSPTAMAGAMISIGAGIGWHKDRSVFADVIGLSLGAAAPMCFRRRNKQGFARRKLSLEPRSIYHLAGEVRHEWNIVLQNRKRRAGPSPFAASSPVDDQPTGTDKISCHA